MLVGSMHPLLGKVADHASKQVDQTVVPALVNQRMIHGMGETWRRYHRDVLEALHNYHDPVYRGQKLKSYAIILILWKHFSLTATKTWKQGFPERFLAIRTKRDIAAGRCPSTLQ